MDRQSADMILRQAGFTPEFVAAGMEGFVFAVGNDMLAKVWLHKTEAEVQLLATFYAQLREQLLPFATPLIHNVFSTSQGYIISIEERLAGVPLKGMLERDPDNIRLRQQGMAATVGVVTALASVEDLPAARELALMGEPSSWDYHASWGAILGELVEKRARRYQTILERAVYNFESKLTTVIAELNTLHIPRTGIIHGDICPENILIDPASMAPIGLLDFGFLTTAGDPCFDAVLATLFFDMYSPHAHEARQELRTMLANASDPGPRINQLYPLYAAAYALAGSNAYSEDGQDGHFQWCIDILNQVLHA
ncbi:phosphotransferase family protein [Dictyobacter formicarum]|uniref:Protein kinase domain-containing protein n=1 Tax=Dictyobacter formicarum TaxID=2778368 RepID=A0ABQ3VSX3_9CHLR|nr:phosphotransferase [Dictyobacter formicarum]GHO88836.1 hypothetical protein KSZ_68420 [Dictyobacter formicarum]